MVVEVFLGFWSLCCFGVGVFQFVCLVFRLMCFRTSSKFVRVCVKVLILKVVGLFSFHSEARLLPYIPIVWFFPKFPLACGSDLKALIATAW